jgi:predicted outer membrane repeat protein
VTTFTITDCSTDRQLQDAVSKALDGDTIIFACSGTIMLTSQLIIKGKGLSAPGLTLSGNGEVVVLDGSKRMGVLLVEDTALTLSGLTIAHGNERKGAGLYNRGGKVSMTNCTFSGNEAAGRGGGLYNRRGGEVSVSHCTFSGNSAQHGGGIHNDGKIIITNCTISGNVARAWGGGFYNNFGSEALVHHTTIAYNSATIAGGWVTGYPPLSMSTTITANNRARSSGDNGHGEITDLGFNLQGDVGLDPAGLHNNGGPTQTIMLQAGSPAIGAVTDNALYPDTDQRGWLRPPGSPLAILGLISLRIWPLQHHLLASKRKYRHAPHKMSCLVTSWQVA